ncbi:MAG TPA: homoserine kinase [Jatrophihabitans sp.]|jgi:homoserine kinase|uniref:homoserine kinase n=1 Tax=Jatrophihabitans sp. TaxID=1932789 RepID=UPI002DF7DFAE|nr:homoserine kinase [Jatrophihabitans sp.]
MRAAFRAGPVHVRVPATSANLGPGFDCLGLALGLHDDVVARATDGGLDIDVAGEGEALARDEGHLVVRAMRATFDKLGGQPYGLQLSCANRIPHGRGLGSSAAAIVAGVVLARGLVVGGEHRLPDADAFALAARLEGHPDNVAACFYGGLTIAWTQDRRARAVRAEVSDALRPVVLVPPFESSTATARGALPRTVPHADATHAAARSALLVAALTGALDGAGADTLLAATEDRLHQPYRAANAPATTELIAGLRDRGLAAVVSGAGPTVLVLARDEVEVEIVTAATPAGWRCDPLAVDVSGARIVPVRTATGPSGP